MTVVLVNVNWKYEDYRRTTGAFAQQDGKVEVIVWGPAFKNLLNITDHFVFSTLFSPHPCFDRFEIA